MKKTLLAIGVLAMAAIMSSCGGNANNSTAPADQQTTTTNAKCSDKCSDQCTNKENCPNKDNCTEKPCADKPATTQAVDLTKKYVCPNRDGSSDQPGECPACGMDLIEN